MHLNYHRYSRLDRGGMFKPKLLRYKGKCNDQKRPAKAAVTFRPVNVLPPNRC